MAKVFSFDFIKDTITIQKLIVAFVGPELCFSEVRLGLMADWGSGGFTNWQLS